MPVCNVLKYRCLGKIPGISRKAWDAVAKMVHPDGTPVTSLTGVIMEASGTDQMSMEHTITFFSEKVSAACILLFSVNFYIGLKYTYNITSNTISTENCHEYTINLTVSNQILYLAVMSYHAYIMNIFSGL